MKSYLLSVSAAVQRQLIYRAKFILWLINDLSHIFILPFLWLAIYAERTNVGSYTREDILTYFVILAFVSVATASHHATYLISDIINGRVSELLTKPQNFILRRLCDGYGYNVLGGVIILPIIGLFTIFFPSYLYIPSESITILLFIISLALANLLSASVQFIVGLLAFWFGNSRAFMQLRFMLEKIFSGEFAPIALYPLYLQQIAAILPFAYFYYIPIQIYLEKITAGDALRHLATGGIWLISLWIIAALLWRRGLYRYDGSGI